MTAGHPVHYTFGEYIAHDAASSTKHDAHTIINPRVLVEVLSPSTETYDRGDRLEHYKRIPTLAACLLVAHDRRAIVLWTRKLEGAWSSSTALAGESVAIAAIGAHLDVDAIYDDAGEPDS